MSEAVEESTPGEGFVEETKGNESVSSSPVKDTEDIHDKLAIAEAESTGRSLGDAQENSRKEEVSNTSTAKSGQDIQESPVKRTKKLKSEVKRPSGKWILYLMEQRPILMKEQPSITFPEATKLVGEKYRNLSAEENQRIDDLADREKERWRREMAEAEDDGPYTGEVVSMEAQQQLLPANHLAFPLSKVKRSCKLDPDVKNVSKDATLVITKAVELFVGFLARKCAYTVSLKGSRRINETDLIQTIYMHENLEFLRVDFPRKPSSSSSSSSASNSSSSSGRSGGRSGVGGGGYGRNTAAPQKTDIVPSHRLLFNASGGWNTAASSSSSSVNRANSGNTTNSNSSSSSSSSTSGSATTNGTGSTPVGGKRGRPRDSVAKTSSGSHTGTETAAQEGANKSSNAVSVASTKKDSISRFFQMQKDTTTSTTTTSTSAAMDDSDTAMMMAIASPEAAATAMAEEKRSHRSPSSMSDSGVRTASTTSATKSAATSASSVYVTEALLSDARAATEYKPGHTPPLKQSPNNTATAASTTASSTTGSSSTSSTSASASAMTTADDKVVVSHQEKKEKKRQEEGLEEEEEEEEGMDVAMAE